MARRWTSILLASAWVGATGCGGARERLTTLFDRISANDDDDGAAAGIGDVDAPLSTVDPAASEAATPAPSATTAATSTTTGPARPEELAVRDVTVEWVDRTGRFYYPSTPTTALRVEATGKVSGVIGRDSNITVKAVCGADPAPVADAELAAIRGSYSEPVPSGPEEFPVHAELFHTLQPSNPTLCRVKFMLIDNEAKPPRRGAVELCWHKGSKAASACTNEDELPPHAEVRDGWGIERAEFTPSGELLFSVVAGRTRAPERIALRTTCYVGDKRYVDFDYLLGRWYALAPGEGMRQRTGMTDLADLLRFSECDLAFQDASYDFEKFALRGTKDIQHLCVRPNGLVRGACRIEASESRAWDPKIAPAKVEYSHSGGHAYRGLMNAYVQGDFTVLAGLPKDAKVELVVRCAKREARQELTFPIDLELVWPGQSVRVWSSIALATKSMKDCELETTLAAKDSTGTPTTWSLARSCFDKHGTTHPCPK